MPEPVCQSHLPFEPWLANGKPRLPGLSPVPLADWIMTDDAFAAQMAVRDRLIIQHPGDVCATTPGSDDSARELLAILIEEVPLRPGYAVTASGIIRPDGVHVDTGAMATLATAGRLVQEDLVLLQDTGNGHHMTAGCVCFPASWTLGEKIGKSLLNLHGPVPEFGPDMTARVQRIFTVLQPDQPVMRWNYLVYADPALYQPRPEYARRTFSPGGERFVRVERQTLRKLPDTGAVVFAIHTFQVRADTLDDSSFRALERLKPALRA